MKTRHLTNETDRAETELSRFNLDEEFSGNEDLGDIFIGLTKLLEKYFDLDRGLLVVREAKGTRFLAVSSWTDDKVRKNLSLRIPETSSLFEKVAEHGILFTENFCDLFSGNSFERNLLLNQDAQSYMLQPLKHEGLVVGLLGYSSTSPMAFPSLENGLLDSIAEQLASRIASQLTASTTA